MVSEITVSEIRCLNGNGLGKLELSWAVPRTDIQLAFFPFNLLRAFKPF